MLRLSAKKPSFKVPILGMLGTAKKLGFSLDVQTFLGYQFAPCLSTRNMAESMAETAGLKWGNQQIICGIIELPSQRKNIDGSLGFCYSISSLQRGTEAE